MDSQLSLTSDWDRVVHVFRSHPSSVCAACGQVLRHLEDRHSVGGAVFHVGCVPAQRPVRLVDPRETA
jgi:hypothetical protein